MERASWRERYALALKETVSVKDIMKLRNCGQPKAAKLRQQAIQYCVDHNIEFECRMVPTQVIFEITNYNLDYYYQKMMYEAKHLQLEYAYHH